MQLERQRQTDLLWVQGQSGLYIELQVNQGYTETLSQGTNEKTEPEQKPFPNKTQ